MICERCGAILEIGAFPFCKGDPSAHAKGFTRVNGDEIPGGFIDENMGHEPVRYDSWSERRRLMKERGLVDATRHVGSQGSDKNPHTQRWDVCPAALLISEDERIAHLRAWDVQHGLTPREHPVAIVVPEPEPTFTPEQYREIAAVASRVL